MFSFRCHIYLCAMKFTGYCAMLKSFLPQANVAADNGCLNKGSQKIQNSNLIFILCTDPPPLSKKLTMGPFSIFYQGRGGGTLHRLCYNYLPTIGCFCFNFSHWISPVFGFRKPDGIAWSPIYSYSLHPVSIFIVVQSRKAQSEKFIFLEGMGKNH